MGLCTRRPYAIGLCTGLERRDPGYPAPRSRLRACFENIPVGLAAAFVTGLLVIAGFLTFIKQHTFKPFAYYRIALGILVLTVLG